MRLNSHVRFSNPLSISLRATGLGLLKTENYPSDNCFLLCG